jgi:hypothetical protein
MGNAKTKSKIRFATTEKGLKIWFIRKPTSSARKPLHVRKKKAARSSQKTG